MSLDRRLRDGLQHSSSIVEPDVRRNLTTVRRKTRRAVLRQRAELVDENQRVFGRRAEHFGEILDVRAEGRQARQDRLLVADVGVDVVEDGDP